MFRLQVWQSRVPASARATSTHLFGGQAPVLVEHYLPVRFPTLEDHVVHPPPRRRMFQHQRLCPAFHPVFRVAEADGGGGHTVRTAG
jgi:hypothetical protein